MTDRNLTTRSLVGQFTTKEGMRLYIPPSEAITIQSIPAVIDPYAETATQKWPLGTELRYGEEVYRYCRNGAGAGTLAYLFQAVVPLAGHIAEAIDAPVVGATTIAFTPAVVTTDDLAANELQDGYIFVYSSTGAGDKYRIKSHPAIVGAVSGVLTLYDPIRTAPAAGSTATVVHNQYRNVIVHDSPPTAKPVGVCPILVTANYYFWIQVRGPACTFMDSGGTAVVIGQPVVPSAEHDGMVQMFDPDIATEPNAGIVGWVLEIGADNGVGFTYLTLE